MPTRTEIIEAGARAIAGEYDRRNKFKPGSWWSGKHRRHALQREAEAALSAMLPLINQSLAAEVRMHKRGINDWNDDVREHTARIIEEHEPAP